MFLARITGIVLGTYSPCQNRRIARSYPASRVSFDLPRQIEGNSARRVKIAVNQICRFGSTKSGRNVIVACTGIPLNNSVQFITVIWGEKNICNICKDPKSFKFASDRHWTGHFKYTVKTAAPSVEPRGTPHAIVFRLDSALPTLTYCLRLVI